MYKILVVEDEQNVQELIVEFLTSQNYEVSSAANGMEAWELFKEKNYDLVITDIMMPKMDGYQLVQLIRSKSEIPVIMLTALGEENHQVRGFDLEVDDYITKPFSFTIFIKRVEAVLRRAYKDKTKDLGFKNIRIDLDGHSVFVDGKEIQLTLKEFELLCSLIEHRGKVLSREQLLDSIWGYDFFGDTRVVDTHIKNLRKKLQVDYIQTVKGVGYKIDD
ncbi:response regulator transcription factor [Culicoidibacter larvae]|uniref:Response regulator transcription factor n=1 Tax=Culicoidibacter larvae TaxID=2579976 RepID=A0A5R8Q8K4_9FIRM|nr:response regulator transcription factor [Culicoidibacter larvae]TLG72031.1 response regulator transcription factor [Culicoidibacter larvae]